MESQSSWTVRPQPEVPAEVVEACAGHVHLAAALVQRGIRTFAAAQAFLDPTHYVPSPAHELAGVREGAELLHSALERGQRILIWGDFDADGQTSTALLASGLKQLARHEDLVHWHVPHRIRDNHGIQADRLQQFLDNPDWQPELLVTCDTGIDAVEGLALARAAGLTIIVTDHHDLPANFGAFTPGANVAGDPGLSSQDGSSIRSLVDVIVNPKLMLPTHPQAALPGVGVTFLLMLELYTRLGRAAEATAFLDLVAIGIVADVAEQTADTRYWLQRGMSALNQTARVGVHALLHASRAHLGSLRTEDIAFSIAPKMNAAGRLADASLTIELLLTSDPGRAATLAATLHDLNEERKILTTQMFDEAMAQLERNPNLQGQHSIVLAHKSWHPGILGLVASRIAEMYGSPVVLLQIQNDNIARGSARSVEGVDIGAALVDCQEWLHTSGGHAQAAGLSLAPGKLSAFRQALDQAVARHTENASGTLVADRKLALREIDRQLWSQLQRLEPTGKGNPEFLGLSTNLTVENWRRIGRGQSTMRRFQVRQSGHAFPLSAVWFRCPLQQAPAGPIDLVYALRMNTYRGNSQIELRVHSGRLHHQAVAEITQPGQEFPYEIEDLRCETPPAVPRPTDGTSIWYAEGLQLNEEQRCTRFDLADSGKEECDDIRHLVIWSSPPSRQVLTMLLTARSWHRVTLMAHEPPLPDAAALPQIVYGMCRYAVRARDGMLAVPRMAARLGLTETVIKLCLTLLVEQGLIQTAGETVVVTVSSGSAPGALARAQQLGQQAIAAALQEVHSFRFLYRTEESKFLLA